MAIVLHTVGVQVVCFVACHFGLLGSAATSRGRGICGEQTDVDEERGL